MAIWAALGGFARGVGANAGRWAGNGVSVLQTLDSFYPAYVQTVHVVVVGTGAAEMSTLQYLAYSLAFSRLSTRKNRFGLIAPNYSVKFLADWTRRRVEVTVQQTYTGFLDAQAGGQGRGLGAMTRPLGKTVVGGDWPKFFKPPADDPLAPQTLPDAGRLLITTDNGEGLPVPNNGRGTNFTQIVAASLLAPCDGPYRPNPDTVPAFPSGGYPPPPPPVNPLPPKPPPPPPPPFETTELTANVPQPPP